MKTLIVDTFNGEGYSNPTIKVSHLRNSTETLEIIDDMRMTYCQEEYVEEEIDGDNKGDVILCLNAEEDQGSIHIMDLPDSQFYIVQVRPQINEVKFFVKMPTKEKALETLKEYVIYDDKYGFDEDDVEDYDGEDFFGSHANNLDCEYYHFEIVQG